MNLHLMNYFLAALLQFGENHYENDFSLASTLIILGGMSCPHAFATDSREAGQTVTRNEEQVSIPGTEKIFTGNARIDRLYPANNKMRSNGTSITFEPGARTHWHVHPVGQVLIITSGLGRTQEWGKPIQEIRPGDVVICPAGIKHWHGRCRQQIHDSY